MANEKRILYIMGSGRSGTTLLDILLGHGKGIRSLGEVVRFGQLEGRPHGFSEETRCYAFWRGVAESFFAKAPDLSYEQIKAMTARLEHHNNLLRVLPARYSSGEAENYRRYVNAFFESLEDHCPETVWVDSSKYPLRLLLLQRLCRYRVDVLYLRRDPAQVVRSFGKQDIEQPSKGFWAATAYYFLNNMLCRLVMGRLPQQVRRYSLRYESLMQQPVASLSAIEQALDLDLSPTKAAIEKGVPIPVGLLFEGNRLRLKQETRLEPPKPASRPTWKDRLVRLINTPWY